MPTASQLAWHERQSPWRNGKGDLVRMFCDSARRYGLKGEMAEGGVMTLCRGSAIGHKRIETLPKPVALRALRVRVTDDRGASPLTVSAYRT